MVENGGGWQPLIDAVASVAGHQDGLRLDAQFAQEGNWQHCLSLAVPISAPPRLVSGCWTVVASRQADVDVADTVLDEAKRRLGANGGIVRGSRDPVGLGFERRRGWQRGGIHEERTQGPDKDAQSG